MNQTRLGLLAFLLLTLLSPFAGAETPDPESDAFWYGAAADGTPTVRLYYFFSPTCPHCQAAKPFLQEMAGRKPWLEIKRYAVKDNRANAKFYFETAKSLGVEALSVPGFVFCREVVIGYDSAATTGADIEKAIDACHANRLANPGADCTAAGRPGAGAARPPPSKEKPVLHCTCRSSARSMRRRCRCRCSRSCSRAWTHSTPARSSCCCSC